MLSSQHSTQQPALSALPGCRRMDGAPQCLAALVTPEGILWLFTFLFVVT